MAAVQRLPEQLPIFPLTGVLLLPGADLPLQVFEPRYRTMIEAALGAERMIGIVQPREPQPDPVSDTAPLYVTGCAGRIVSFTETDDGRYLISLRGVCRFRIAEELSTEAAYRRVRADFEPFRDDLGDDAEVGFDRERLLQALRRFLHAAEMGADWSAIEEANDEELVSALAMGCPFEPREKQALLECSGLAERAELLLSLLDMAVRDIDGPPSGSAPH